MGEQQSSRSRCRRPDRGSAVLIECFSYEMPLDYEVGKPSVLAGPEEAILFAAYQEVGV